MSRVVVSRGASRVRPRPCRTGTKMEGGAPIRAPRGSPDPRKGGMRSRKTRQCRENFPHMPTHGLFSCLRIALFQRADNVTMLLDQHREGRGLGQAEMAHAIGLGARSFDHAHRVIAIDTVGDSPMEGLIQFGEGHIVEEAAARSCAAMNSRKRSRPAASIRPAASRTTAHSIASRTKRALRTSFTEIFVT